MIAEVAESKPRPQASTEHLYRRLFYIYTFLYLDITSQKLVNSYSTKKRNDIERVWIQGEQQPGAWWMLTVL